MALYPQRPDLLTLKSTNPLTGTAFKLAFDDQGASVFADPTWAMPVGGTWTAARNAQGDLSLNKTAGAATTYLLISLRNMFKLVMPSQGMYDPTQVADRGVKIKSVNVVYSIGTAALTTHTATFNKVVYANNAANVVSAYGGSISGTLATATQAQPYVSTLTMGTPAFDMTALANLNMEIAVVDPGTSVYKFYGVFINFDQNSI